MRNLATALCAIVLMSGGCAESDSVPSAGTHRVWSGDDPDFSTGDISPDGRYLSDIDWNSGDLQLVDLTGGQAREVTGKGYDAGRYAWSSAFSTDGRRLALADESFRGLVTGRESTGLLRSLSPSDGVRDPGDQVG